MLTERKPGKRRGEAETLEADVRAVITSNVLTLASELDKLSKALFLSGKKVEYSNVRLFNMELVESVLFRVNIMKSMEAEGVVMRIPDGLVEHIKNYFVFNFTDPEVRRRLFYANYETAAIFSTTMPGVTIRQPVTVVAGKENISPTDALFVFREPSRSRFRLVKAFKRLPK